MIDVDLEQQVKQLRLQVARLKAREDRLWNTLMSVSAVMRGAPMPPVPDITQSYYAHFVTDAHELYVRANRKNLWARIFSR